MTSNVAQAAVLDVLNQEYCLCPISKREYPSGSKGKATPFEIRVAEACAKSGLRVRQSDYYVDPVFDKPREIDVSASLQREVGEVLAKLSLSIECKADNSKP
jgi:hypothetical protein